MNKLIMLEINHQQIRKEVIKINWQNYIQNFLERGLNWKKEHLLK